MTDSLRRTDRTTHRRKPTRGSFERALADAVLDEAHYVDVAFALPDGAPLILPMAHVRVGDALYLHGAPRNRVLDVIGTGAPLAVSATRVDGLVLAKSHAHHSMNYRSVVLLGAGRAVTDREEKRAVLHALVEKLEPGRTHRSRAPSDAELDATSVVAIAIDEGSYKARSGGPTDGESDRSLPHPAGVIPLGEVRGALIET